jgi:hydroxyquinol 1,2-dioxygenase
MRPIDEDTITQAVIARHAAARDARLREVMTSLVQHLHAFAREVKLTEAEWAAGLDFVAECGRRNGGLRPETALLSDALGLSTLVQALQRRAGGVTEPSVAGAVALDAVNGQAADAAKTALVGEPCHVSGRVSTADGQPIAGAQVQIVVPGRAAAHGDTQRTDSQGQFSARVVVPLEQPIPHDGPVGRLLDALGRPPWRPAHLQFSIAAPGYERLVTQVFRRGDRHLDSDAVFGVRRSLVVDWVPHGPGRTPDGHTSAVPFNTLDFSFVLNANTTTGDKP